MKNYSELISSARNRLNPEGIYFRKGFNEELSTISYSDVLTYVRLAMKSVEPEYTNRTKEAGEKVKTHLKNGLSNAVFRYQGSVMTNTHIKGYSDIDLLVISDKFFTWDAYNVKQILNDHETSQKYSSDSIAKLLAESKGSSYGGDTLDDLRKLRSDGETILYGVYDICDISKPKSIKITNKSLNRDVDVVIANWYDDVRSIINSKGDYRGIQVYDKENDIKGSPDYPFTSILKINIKSSETNGRLKKMIRFLKNIKSDSKIDIDLSSFDINAICFDINASDYQYLSYYELVTVILRQLRRICTDANHANKIVSVDGREYIFKSNPDKLENVKKILGEVESIANELKSVPIYG